jgi:hypothetical protein
LYDLLEKIPVNAALMELAAVSQILEGESLKHQRPEVVDEQFREQFLDDYYPGSLFYSHYSRFSSHRPSFLSRALFFSSMCFVSFLSLALHAGLQ